MASSSKWIGYGKRLLGEAPKQQSPATNCAAAAPSGSFGRELRLGSKKGYAFWLVHVCSSQKTIRFFPLKKTWIFFSVVSVSLKWNITVQLKQNNWNLFSAHLNCFISSNLRNFTTNPSAVRHRFGNIWAVRIQEEVWGVEVAGDSELTVDVSIIHLAIWRWRSAVWNFGDLRWQSSTFPSARNLRRASSLARNLQVRTSSFSRGSNRSN